MNTAIHVERDKPYALWMCLPLSLFLPLSLSFSPSLSIPLFLSLFFSAQWLFEILRSFHWPVQPWVPVLSLYSAGLIPGVNLCVAEAGPAPMPVPAPAPAPWRRAAEVVGFSWRRLAVCRELCSD